MMSSLEAESRKAKRAQGGLLPLSPPARQESSKFKAAPNYPPSRRDLEGGGGGLGIPPPRPTEPLLAPPAPGPTGPRSGLRPRRPSPHARTQAHPPEAAALAPFLTPQVGHVSDQVREGAVRAVETVAFKQAAPEPGPARSDRASDTAPRPGRFPADRPPRRRPSLGP